MPGRLAIYDDIEFKQDISNIFHNFDDKIQILHKKYNISPTLDIPIFTNKMIYTYGKFGLIPSWANGKKNFNINARSETLLEKSSFKEPFKTKRGIVPVNGYYEWVKDPFSKQSIPYMIHSLRKTYLGIAAIYDYWYDNTIDHTLLTISLITTQPNSIIEPIHQRMPVILEQKDWKLWLDQNSSFHQLSQLFTPICSDLLKITKVNSCVNSVKNNSPLSIQESNNIIMRQPSLF